jgi:hypothetical protein
VTSTSTLATTSITSLLFGTTTAFSLAKMHFDTTTVASGSTNAIGGIYGNYTFSPVGGGVQVGNRFVVNNAPTGTANTSVGEIIRSIDNTSLANTVRGIEIVSNAGSNSQGINTGIRTTGGTFGIQAFTTGLAGGVSSPAAIYGESTATTGTSSILSLYSSTMTTAPYLAQIYQEVSNYSGTGLYMDIGANGGTFSGNFVNFQNNDVTKFIIDNAGKVGIGTSTLSSAKVTVVGDIRVGDSGTNGCIQGFGGATLTGTCTSDQNLKTNISDVVDVLNRLASVRVVNYKWNQTARTVYGNDTTQTQTGYLAQNIEALFPELVVTNKEGFKQVNYTGMSLYAIEGVKELAQRNASTTETLHKLSTAIDLSALSGSSTALTILNNGSIGIGASHPLVLLHVASSTATGTIARFENVTGYCDIDPTTHALMCTTDDATRVNELLIDSTSTVATSTDITATAASSTLEKLSQLHVVTYHLAGEDITSTTTARTGLMMADIQALFPELVKVDSNGKSTFSLSTLVPYIIESIKTLTQKVSQLALEIKDLKNSLTTNEVKTNTLCLGQTCVTESQLKTLLQQQASSPPQTPSNEPQVMGTSTGGTSSDSSVPIDTGTTTPPGTDTGTTSLPNTQPPGDPIATSTNQPVP